jgi:hypothetical protein
MNVLLSDESSGPCVVELLAFLKSGGRARLPTTEIGKLTISIAPAANEETPQSAGPQLVATAANWTKQIFRR